MKRIKKQAFIAVLIGTIALSSCSLMGNNSTPILPPSFSSLYELNSWIANNIRYKLTGYYWQTPTQTLDQGYGDCKDDSLLLMYLAKKYFNADSSLIVGYVDVNGKKIGHAVVQINNMWYDPASGNTYNVGTVVHVVKTMSYVNSMNIASTLHVLSTIY